MKLMTIVHAAVLLLLTTSCQKSDSLELGEWKVYHNPVYSETVTADPCIFRDTDGTFYVYSTATSEALIPILKSTDLISWELVGEAFETKPDFIPNANLWAPDVRLINGRYLLYYALSGKEAGDWDTGIGVAVADSPLGPFQDLGKILTAEEIGVYNSIDPMIYEEDGHIWMLWGSFGGYAGVHMIELEQDGLSIKEGAEKIQLTAPFYEAPYIFKKDGYYYMFASPSGLLPSSYPDPSLSSQAAAAAPTFPDRITTKAYVQPSYRAVVGRAESLTGPYLNSWGQPMMEKYHNYLIGPGPVFAGPGHNAEIVTDDAGTDWFVYHAYCLANEDLGRILFIDPIIWEDGWPVIRHQYPSSSGDAPVFNRR